MTGSDSPESGRTDERVRLTVDDVGGISSAEVSISDGVTLVSGANASNKSSLLRALSGVLGGPVPPLKSDADAGSVRLSVDGTEYHLTLAREDGETVVTSSDCYSDAGDLCELFVSLTELNPIRRAIVAGDDLYDLLLRPVDTDEIETEISRLTEEKASLDERLEEIDSLADRLPTLRTRRDRIREKLAEVEQSLEEKRDAIEQIEGYLDADGDDATVTLSAKRSERNEIRNRIRTQEDAIDSLEDELESVTAQLRDTPVEDRETTIEEIDAELEGLHHQKQQLTSTINALSPIVDMNSQILDEEAEVPDAMTADDIVAELDPSSRTITCWTCGSTVERAQIAEQVESVREIVREKRNQRDTITERIQLLTERKRDLEQRRSEREQLQNRRDRLKDEIAQRESTLEELRADRSALESEIQELQREIEETTEAESRLAEYYESVTDLEYERGQLATDLEAVESEIEDVEAAVSQRPEIESRRASVEAELRDERERIDTLERDLVETFNETMGRVLETLSYGSIERVWIERHSTGPHLSSETTFELHVVRTNEDGAAYDDTVDSLSKSEREVVGLVVALAGYLAHDVADQVPFLVVDAVEMLDADRIHGLMEHFDEHAAYVVATVLPEERAQLDGAYDVISTASVVADP